MLTSLGAVVYLLLYLLKLIRNEAENNGILSREKPGFNQKIIFFEIYERPKKFACCLVTISILDFVMESLILAQNKRWRRA